MTTTAIIEILKAHLHKEGLALCKAGDTQFALDGIKEVEALSEIVALVDDTLAIREWDGDDSKTTEIPAARLAELRAAS